jgi:hypothetical protein
MSGSILERLEARISAKPAVINVHTLISDLEEAHAEIVALNAKIKEITTVGTPPVAPMSDQAANAALQAAVIAPHMSPSTVAHVHTLLTDAKERLSVNALGTVVNHIESALKLLEG